MFDIHENYVESAPHVHNFKKKQKALENSSMK